MTVCMLPQSFQISIHAPREGSDTRKHPAGKIQTISIHAPREGSDYNGVKQLPQTMLFLSTLPARGATRTQTVTPPAASKFLSTLPARGATDLDAVAEDFRHDFYPRSPRGERRHLRLYRGRPAGFLSTLPARGATRTAVYNTTAELFLSTLPARGATTRNPEKVRAAYISIHAPREGSDVQGAVAHLAVGGISIHAPREGSDRGPASTSRGWKRSFLSTLPARGATRQRCQCAEADKFLSTLPARGATLCLGTAGSRGNISIHAPREGSDRPRGR